MTSVYQGGNNPAMFSPHKPDHSKQLLDLYTAGLVHATKVKVEPTDDTAPHNTHMTDERPVDMSLPNHPRDPSMSANNRSASTGNGSRRVGRVPDRRQSPSSKSDLSRSPRDRSPLVTSPPSSGSTAMFAGHYFPAGPFIHGGGHGQPISPYLQAPRDGPIHPSAYMTNALLPAADKTLLSPSGNPQSPGMFSPMSMAVSPSRSDDVSGFTMKSNNGKLTIPSVLKNGIQADESTMDMIPLMSHQRAKREFVPNEKKDEGYWCKRYKNNDSARRSRVKRKALERMMESRLLELQKENIELKHEMQALKRRFGISGGNSIADDSPGSDSGFSTHASSSPFSLDAHSRGQSPDTEEGNKTDSSQRDDRDTQEGSDDSRFNDDSRVYSGLDPTSRGRTDSTSSSTRSLVGSASGQVRGHHYRSSPCTSSSPTSSVCPTTKMFDSRGSQSNSGTKTSTSSAVSAVSAAAIRMDKSGALDLTGGVVSDHSNRSTPARDLSSPDSCGSTATGATGGMNAGRRFSCLSSDGSLLDDGIASRSSFSSSSSSSSSETKSFLPLKCRWKKCVQLNPNDM